METNDLRLGNYIMDKKDENIEYVYRLHNLGDYMCINDLHPDACLPIPLTEWWIKQLEFKPISEESGNTPNTFERDGFQIWNKNGDFSEIMYLNNQNSIVIQYVHQLQNLFFALKGKEL